MTHPSVDCPLKKKKKKTEIQSRKPDQFNVVFTLDKPPKNWKGETGYVNAEVVKKSLAKFGTSADKGTKVKVFVCELSLSRALGCRPGFSLLC